MTPAAQKAIRDAAARAVVPIDSRRDGKSRPQIRVRQELNPVTEEAIAAITARSDLGVYVRGRRLVAIARDGSHRDRWLKRAPGTPVIVAIEKPRMLGILDEAIEWVKYDARERQEVTARPPDWVAAQILGRLEWPFRYLEMVTETPTLRPDGSVLSTPGYDESTGLLFDPAPGVQWPDIPERPTVDELGGAIEALLEPVTDFPFVAESDRSAFLAAVLSLIGRPGIDGPVPMFPIGSPAPGTGKGLLASVIGMIGTGREPSVMTAPGGEDEWRKRITSLAIGGAAVVLLDNLSGSVGSDTLAAALTSTSWEDRVLGLNQMATTPLRAVWLATGNNLGFKRTLGRRVVPIDLDAGVEQPEDRSNFKHPALLPYIRRERPALVAAALTVLRGFHLAGRPPHGGPRMGSYEAWDDLIRSAIVWAGLEDPASTEGGKARGRIRSKSDDDVEQLGAMLEALRRLFPGAASFVTAQILQHATNDNAFQAVLDAFATPARTGGHATANSIGAKFRDHQDRPVGGLVLRKRERTWRVESTGGTT